ncbi:MAG TPA: hypothetical protein VG345_12870 [Bryobacteraceae bacterium]|jgi:hypothetical protein|nr:hypothetical protein [Bryobacteraceae bacterium]
MTPGGPRLRIYHALAGIGAGVAGALFVLLFLMLGSVWYHHSIWVPANLFSTAFYGPDAYLNRFAYTSWAGVAVVLVMYGVVGAVWGLVWGDSRPRLLLVYGALCGAVTYFLLFGIFWKRVDPLIALYGPERQLEFANIVWGMIVVRSAGFAAGASRADKEVQEEAVAVRSGEVIL